MAPDLRAQLDGHWRSTPHGCAVFVPLHAGCSASINVTVNQTQADISRQFGRDWASYSRLNGGINATEPLVADSLLCIQAAELNDTFTCPPEPGARG